MKKCTKCVKYKSFNDFYKRTEGGLKSHCKECEKKTWKKRYKKNYKKIRKYIKRWAKLNVEKVREYSRKNYYKNYETAKKYRIKNKEKLKLRSVSYYEKIKKQVKKEIKNKRCCKCLKNKFIKNFNKNIYSKDGFQSWCKKCFKNIRRGKKYLSYQRLKNRESFFRRNYKDFAEVAMIKNDLCKTIKKEKENEKS